ncbi:MAG: hypothetical protein ACEQSX_00365 [Baekduiaceae bacterium]
MSTVATLNAIMRADSSHFVSGVTQGTTAVKGLSKEAEVAGAKTTNMGSLASKAMIGIGVAAGALAVKSAAAFERIGGEVLKLQRFTGESAESMSALRFAAQQSGVSVDTLATGIKIASKNFEKSKDTIKEFGVATRDAEGHARPMSAVLSDFANKFQSLPNGAEKTALALKVFGRGGADLIPLLNKGASGMAEMTAKAQEMGLILSGDQLKAVKDAKAAHRDFDAALDSLQVRIGSQVLPMLTGLTNAALSMRGPVVDIIAPFAVIAGTLLGLVAIASKVIGVFGPMVTKIREMDAAASAAGTSSSSMASKIGAGTAIVFGAIAAWEIWNARMKEANKNAESLGAIYETKLKGATTFSELGRQMDVTREQVKGLSDEVANSSAPWDADVRIEMTKYQGELMKVADANARLQEEVKHYADAHHISLDEATRAIQKQRAEAEAQQALKDATEGTTASIEDQVNALRASIDPLFAAENAARKNEDAQRAARDANVEVTNAQKEYNTQSAIWGSSSLQAQKAWNDLTEAQRKKGEADTSVIKSASDLYFAQLKLEDGIKSGTISLDTARDMLDQWVASGSATQEQADAMAWKFLTAANAAHQVPPSLNTKVTADISQAIAKYNELMERYRSGAGRTIGTVIQATPYASGGVENHTAQIAAGGSMRLWAEPETGGEAYIPLAAAKRARSMAILRQVAGRFGVGLTAMANGGWGAGKQVYEDFSFEGMNDKEKKTLAFVKSIWRQEKMRKDPSLIGRPGFGQLDVNPFAGWDPKADFSGWGRKPAPSYSVPSGLSGASGGGAFGAGGGFPSTVILRVGGTDIVAALVREDHGQL